MTPVLVDSGFFVALFDPADRLGAPAARYLRGHSHPLATVFATIVEACFFLTPGRKAELLTWLRRGAVSVVEIPVLAYPQLELTLRKYSDRDVDIADAGLIWLANEVGARRVLTVDRKDFQIYRLKGNRSFEVIDWF